MAHAWKACWCNSLTSSNLVSSARIGTPETVENIRFPGFCFGSFRLSVPSRFPPCRHLRPRPAARVTYRNRRFRKRLRAFARRVSAIEARPRPTRPVSGPIRIPSCSPRSFFVLVRNNPSLRIASASQRIPVGPARRFPRTPSEKRHTNAYGCHESPFEPSINSLIHRQEVKERSSVGWVRRRNRQTPPASLPRVFASERHRLRHDRPRRRHVPRPHPPQRQENTRQGIRFPIRPGKGPGQVANHRAAHQEGGARHSERIDGGGVGGRQIGVAHTDGQGIHQRRRIILPQAAGHQKRGAANPADGYSVPAGAAEGYPRDQP